MMTVQQRELHRMANFKMMKTDFMDFFNRNEQILKGEIGKRGECKEES